MFTKVNLREALEENRKLTENAEKSIIDRVNDWFIADWEKEQKVAEHIMLGASSEFLPSAEEMEKDRIYTLTEIKSLCIDFRLRFLTTRLFKGPIPREALSKVRMLEARIGCEIKAFMIVAPAPLFKLEDANVDPLLFIPLSDGRFYLVHQWGNDLAWYRKLLVWPLASIQNLAVSIIAISAGFAAIVPTSVMGASLAYLNFYRMALMVWCVVFISGMVSYFWFATGQKFSVEAWKSKHFN